MDQPQFKRTSFIAGCIALMTLAAAQRGIGLNPPSLNLDDQWVASLVKAGSMAAWMGVKPQIPLGFLAIMTLLRNGFGGAIGVLQVLPFASSLVQIPALGALAWALTGRLSVGLLAAACCVLCPGFGDYAVRVKPYTVEALLVTAAIAVAMPWARRGRTRDLAWLVAFALGSLWFSFTSLLVCMAWIAAGYVAHCRSERRLWRSPGQTTCLGILALGSLLFYELIAKQSANWSLVEFWAPYYLPWRDPQAALTFLWETGSLAVSGAFTPALAPYALGLVGAGFLALAINRQTRTHAFACALFYGSLIFASMAKAYPLGGGRTDLFSYPVALLLAASALKPLARPGVAGRVATALALAGVGFLLWSQRDHRYPYIGINDSQAGVHFLEEHIQDSDGLIVYPHGMWALAYHGKWPFKLVPDDRVGTNFDAWIVRDRTLNLPTGVGRAEYWQQPTLLLPFLEEFLGAELPAIYYFAAANHDDVDRLIVGVLMGHGYRIDPSSSFGQFTVTKFVKAR